ncbi:transposase [Thermoplasma volcanium]|uniref:transposase n=1 Tax=Thermoplasma volcanium TaxID=50339 RepID=UPI0000164DB3
MYIHWIYSQRWNIDIFFRTMKTYLKIDHLISRKINSIMVQIFTAMIAYIVLMIQDMISCSMSIPKMISLPLRINEAGKASVKA